MNVSERVKKRYLHYFISAVLGTAMGLCTWGLSLPHVIAICVVYIVSISHHPKELESDLKQLEAGK